MAERQSGLFDCQWVDKGLLLRANVAFEMQEHGLVRLYYIYVPCVSASLETSRACGRSPRSVKKSLCPRDWV